MFDDEDDDVGTPGVGHNSHDVATDDRLRLLIERIETIEEEEKGIRDDKKDVYLEAKAVGYNAKIMRMIIKLRKMEPDDRRAQEEELDLYKIALGIY